MVEKDITIVESELKTGAKGEYLLVTDHKGVKFACFQEHKDLWGYLDKNMTASVGFEVKGAYKNIVEAHPIAESIKVDETVIPEQQVAPPVPKPTPPPKSDTKNRAFALSYAKDIACAKIQMGGGIPPREILGIAEMFTVYLDKGMPEEALKAYNQIQKELKKEE